jgi:transposase, IS5 family
MYRKPSKQLRLEDFILPFNGYLNKNNRWVQMAAMIPWDRIEEKYAELFADNIGNEAKSARVALGALIIKEKLGITDRETVDQIRENPYLQYFIGYKEYRDEPPFDHSLMVHFRKRFNMESMRDINEMICMIDKDTKTDDSDEPPPTASGSPGDKTGDRKENKGKLILDATCAPADIRYPTDISLLNEAREKLEAIIDTLYQPLKDVMTKPRTYRKTAHREYLKFAKQRKPRKKQIRRALRKQLGYVSRDLKHVETLLKSSPVTLTNRQQEQIVVIQELYRQQQHMYTHKTHQVEDRIVSISQPHVRPIVRGKANASTEFGAKVAISLVNGYSFIEKLGWNNFNEGNTLIEATETYKQRNGHYPEAIFADTIYRNRTNIAYCKTHNIRLSGPRLGRPPLVKDPALRKIEKQDGKIRNAVEGKLGEGKRRYGLGLIMARLQDTSETVIALQFLVMNLERRLRNLFCLLFKELFLRAVRVSNLVYT